MCCACCPYLCCVGSDTQQPALSPCTCAELRCTLVRDDSGLQPQNSLLMFDDSCKLSRPCRRLIIMEGGCETARFQQRAVDLSLLPQPFNCSHGGEPPVDTSLLAHAFIG